MKNKKFDSNIRSPKQWRGHLFYIFCSTHQQFLASTSFNIRLLQVLQWNEALLHMSSRCNLIRMALCR